MKQANLGPPLDAQVGNQPAPNSHLQKLVKFSGATLELLEPTSGPNFEAFCEDSAPSRSACPFLVLGDC
eukprot:jgi/Botrbrau1/22133/Bobra.0206s0057.1